MAEEMKMTKEQAESEFFAWCEANDIESDIDEMTDDVSVSFEQARKGFVKYLRRGSLVIDGTTLNYEISKFSPQGYAGEKLVINRPSGNIWLAMDGRKDTDRMHKMQNAISALIGKDTGWISKLDAKDWSFLMSVASLFLV